MSLQEVRIALPTRNMGKIREMRAVLAGLPLHILTYEDFAS